MQSYVIFTCTLTLLLTSLHVLAQDAKQVSDDTCTLVQLQMSTSRDKHQLRDVTNNLATLHDKNLVFTSDNKNLRDQLSHVTSQHQTLTEQLSHVTSQHRTLEEKLKTKEDELHLAKVELKSCQVWEQCKESSQKVEENLRDKISDLTNTVTTLRLENENLKSDVSKHVQEKSVMTSQLSELQSKLSGYDMLTDVKTSQSEHKAMLTQVLTKLEQHDAELKSHSNHSCQLHVDLPTTKLNNKTYYFSYKQPAMTWHEADNFCRSHGMHLVSVETRGEWELLKPEVKKLIDKLSALPWSSGSNAAKEGKWKWTATGSDVIFYEHRHMDNVASENCMFLGIDYWADYSCTYKLPFICEVNSQC